MKYIAIINFGNAIECDKIQLNDEMEIFELLKEVDGEFEKDEKGKEKQVYNICGSIPISNIIEFKKQ